MPGKYKGGGSKPAKGSKGPGGHMMKGFKAIGGVGPKPYSKSANAQSRNQGRKK